MKKPEIWIFEIVLSIVFVVLGLTNTKVLFLQGPRAMTIALGVAGMLLCTLSIGKFISAAPAHPLTILGYIFGAIALLAFIAQLFNLDIPLLKEPKTALVILAVAIIAKGLIARFEHLL